MELFNPMKQSGTIRNHLLSILIVAFFPARGTSIIFDLGDVLIETKYLQSVLNIGPLKLVSYALTLKNPFACHTKLFQFLDSLEPHQTELIVNDPYGNRLPQLIYNWLSGSISSEKILTVITNNAYKLDNWIERLLILSLAHTIFDPETFAKTRYIIPEGIEFVKECKKAGHTVYILSNWDPESFTIMKNMYPTFFNLFDGVIISGDSGLIKPDPEIYRYLLKKFHLIPHECILIDDRPENITAAQKMGISGILYTKRLGIFLFKQPDFDTVRDKINLIESSKNFPALINY